MEEATLTRPYKFLSPYEPADAARFFGRDVETDILLADVVVNRLVVLFARTGTGKTSLINAGVRPRLADRGYATYMVRTRPDPVESARLDLARDAPGKFPKKGSLADQLRGLAKAMDCPIVVFFDQFEEFFLYVVSDDVERAEAFVAEVADLYEDDASGVHLVFSLREEWFVDMGFFADEIPEIFHSDANLRLRWFDIEQARAAIVGPVGESAMTQRLVDRLISELVETGQAVAGKPSPGAIEPAQLQIVCDTLWRDRANGVLDVEDYEALARPGRPETVARQVLDRRLVEEFEVFKSREELELLAVLLPQLATSERTKRVREYGDLLASVSEAPGLTKGPTLLRQVLDGLKEAGLVDIVPRGTTELVELTHDYVVLYLDDLLAAIALIWPRRTLGEGVDAWRRSGSLLASDVLPELLEHVDTLPLDREAGELVLRSALGHLVDLGPMLPAAEASGALVWNIIADRVENGTEAEQTRAIESLALLGTPPAFDVLRAALERRTAAPHVIRELAHTPHAAGVDLLKRAAELPELATEARAALATLADGLTEPSVAKRARAALNGVLDRLSPEEVVPALVDLDARIAAELLDENGGHDAREGLVTLATAKRMSPARTEARRRLLVRADQELQLGKIDPGTVKALAVIEEVESARLLGRIAARPAERAEAEQALRTLKRSNFSDVAAAAGKEIDRLAGEPEPEPEPDRIAPPPTLPFDRDPDALSGHFAAMVQLLSTGRLVPFLGAGSALVGRRSGEWQPGATLPNGAELSRELAQQFAYPADEQLDLVRVAQYVEVMYGRSPLEEALHRLLAVPAPEPSVLDRVLVAAMAAMRSSGRTARPLIVSLRFDDHLERSFAAQKLPVSVLTYNARGMFRYAPADGSPVVGTENIPELVEDDDTPLVVKLFGSVAPSSVDDSFVITEDDYVDQALALGRRDFLPKYVEYMLSRASFLFLGYGLRDWNLRVLLRSLENRLDASTRPRSWAIMAQPSRIDIELWRRRDVDIIDVWLDEYAARLEQRLAQTDLGTLPS